MAAVCSLSAGLGIRATAFGHQLSTRHKCRSFIFPVDGRNPNYLLQGIVRGRERAQMSESGKGRNTAGIIDIKSYRGSIKWDT